jgi:hypothetical protein
MNSFNISEFINKEIKEYEHEYDNYMKIKAYYGFQRKRTHQEMTQEKLDIKSPHQSALPIPSDKFFNKN